MRNPNFQEPEPQRRWRRERSSLQEPEPKRRWRRINILREEKKLWRKGFKRLAGLDEAGRGPLAGPVVAAVLMIKKNLDLLKSDFNNNFNNIKDSKKLSAKKREEFYKILTKHPNIEWGIGRVSEKVIDKINILEATKLAMIKALKKIQRPSPDGTVGTKVKKRTLSSSPFKIDYLIIDGNFQIKSSIPQKSIIKGDEKVFSIAAASILAKVARDRIMVRYHKKYPQYRFDMHKGYPTKYHCKMIKKYGPCKIHRKTFYPVSTCPVRNLKKSRDKI